jgi:3-hydroxypropanoate dehydrogenase
MMRLNESGLDLLFRSARTHYAWRPDPVGDDDLRAIWELAKFGPTSANSMPMRVVWLRSAAAKARLLPALSESNRDKTMTAPVTGIVAHDLDFPDTLAETFPHTAARSWFDGKPALIEATAFRNGTMQGAYLLFAARALGFDCGPMSGFDNAAVDAAFFPAGRVRSNFLLNLGHGSGDKLFPRLPRLGFDRVCTIL